MSHTSTLPDRADAIELIRKWKTRLLALDSSVATLSAILSPAPENPFYQNIWNMADEYTATLAALIGDEEGFLDWYRTECRLGATPKEVHFTDGETLIVVGPEDLLDAIWTTEDGRRDWSVYEDWNAGGDTPGATEQNSK